MATLEEYAARRFPQHRLRVRSPQLSLSEHTAVAELKGAAAAEAMTDRLRRELPNARVGLVLVLPNSSTLIATSKEDTEGSIDLPRKRPFAVAIGVAVAVGVIGLFIARAVIGNWVGAVVAAVFLAAVGGVVGALLGGAGRYAGDRAWEQERQGDDAIGLVAICSNDERSANEAAARIEQMGADVRIVSATGGWHVPNT